MSLRCSYFLHLLVSNNFILTSCNKCIFLHTICPDFLRKIAPNWTLLFFFFPRLPSWAINMSLHCSYFYAYYLIIAFLLPELNIYSCRQFVTIFEEKSRQIGSCFFSFLRATNMSLRCSYFCKSPGLPKYSQRKFVFRFKKSR